MHADFCRLSSGAAPVVVRLDVVCFPTRSSAPTVAVCLLGLAGLGGYPVVPACCCRGRLARAGSGSHSGVELWRSRTGKGSSGGRKKGVV